MWNAGMGAAKWAPRRGGGAAAVTGSKGPYSRPRQGWEPCGVSGLRRAGTDGGRCPILWDIVAHFAGKRKALRMENRRKMCDFAGGASGWVFFWAGI